MTDHDPTADAVLGGYTGTSPSVGCEGETDDAGQWIHDRACAFRRQRRARG